MTSINPTSPLNTVATVIQSTPEVTELLGLHQQQMILSSKRQSLLEAYDLQLVSRSEFLRLLNAIASQRAELRTAINKVVSTIGTGDYVGRVLEQLLPEFPFLQSSSEQIKKSYEAVLLALPKDGSDELPSKVIAASVDAALTAVGPALAAQFPLFGMAYKVLGSAVTANLVRRILHFFGISGKPQAQPRSTTDYLQTLASLRSDFPETTQDQVGGSVNAG